MGADRDVTPAGDGRREAVYPVYPGAAGPRPRPPLTTRMRPGHWIALDCVVGVVAALCGAASIDAHLPSGQSRISLFLLFMTVIFLCVGLRRRAPAPAFGALVILGTGLSVLPLAVDGVVFLAGAYVLYTVTVQGRRRAGFTALGLLLAVMIVVAVGVSIQRPEGAGDGGVFIPVALASVIACLIGYSVRQRRRYAAGLQLEAATRAVSEERLRIARELHDVVAHSMSVIAVQAGYGQYVIGASPDAARNALGAIQATSRDALDEMRRMLGVLRQQDSPAPDGPGDVPVSPGDAPVRRADPDSRLPLAPAPGLAGLERLLTRTRGAGVRVSLEIAGPARPAPAGVDLSAYRIIQEALTNVVRHAGTGAACAVTLHYAEAGLNLRVTDDGGRASRGGAAGAAADIAAAGTGHGLIGMRERVHLCGGTFSAGPRPGGGFDVTAALPLPSVVLAAAVPAPAGPPPWSDGTADGPAVGADPAGGRA